MHVYFFLSLFWLHWSLQAFPSFREWGLSLWTSHRRGVSCCGVQTLGGSWASEAVDPSLYSRGSVIVAHGDSGVCRILLDKESNQRPLHWQAGPFPLDHQGCLGICACYFPARRSRHLLPRADPCFCWFAHSGMYLPSKGQRMCPSYFLTPRRCLAATLFPDIQISETIKMLPPNTLAESGRTPIFLKFNYPVPHLLGR